MGDDAPRPRRSRLRGVSAQEHDGVERRLITAAREDAPAENQPFGEMHCFGVRGLLNYGSDYMCSHSVAISADQWSDHIRLSDIEPGSCARNAFGSAVYPLARGK